MDNNLFSFIVLLNYVFSVLRNYILPVLLAVFLVLGIIYFWKHLG